MDIISCEINMAVHYFHNTFRNLQKVFRMKEIWPKYYGQLKSSINQMFS